MLRPNEIVTQIVVPPAPGARNATYEVRQKQALDWPLATASVVLAMKGETISSARVVLGHVAPVPWAAEKANEFLKTKTLSEDVADQAGWTALLDATPLSQNAYKVQLARVAVKRALLDAVRKV